jgi:hypothetical protein
MPACFGVHFFWKKDIGLKQSRLPILTVIIYTYGDHLTLNNGVDYRKKNKDD